jgi:hypothetical protein
MLRRDAGMKDPGLSMASSWLEFGRACDCSLIHHVQGYRVRNFLGQDVTESIMQSQK